VKGVFQLQRWQFHPLSLHVKVKDEKQPLELDIGSLFADIGLVTKRSRSRILPLRRAQVRRKPCHIRYLIIVRVLAEEELSALQDGKMARQRDSSPLFYAIRFKLRLYRTAHEAEFEICLLKGTTEPP